MEWGWFLPAARNGETWRQGRKLLDRGLRPGAASAYRPMQESKARVLLTRILKEPKDWEAHVELYAMLLSCSWALLRLILHRVAYRQN